MAYQSNESGRFEIYVRPFPGSGGASSAAAAVGTPGGQWQVSTVGGVSPRWRPDGKELYDMAPDRTLMAAPSTITVLDDVAAAPITLLQNWQPKAKK